MPEQRPLKHDGGHYRHGAELLPTAADAKSDTSQAHVSANSFEASEHASFNAPYPDEADGQMKEASKKLKGSGNELSSNKALNTLATRGFDDEMDLSRAQGSSGSNEGDAEGQKTDFSKNQLRINNYESGESVDSILVKEMKNELFGPIDASPKDEETEDQDPSETKSIAQRKSSSFKEDLLRFLRRIQVNIGFIWLGYVVLVCVVLLLVANTSIYSKIHSAFEVFMLIMKLEIAKNFEDELSVISSAAEEVSNIFSSGIVSISISEDFNNLFFRLVSLTPISGIIFQLRNGTLHGVDGFEHHENNEFHYISGTTGSITKYFLNTNSKTFAIDYSKPPHQLVLASATPCNGLLNQTNYDEFKGSWSNFHPWHEEFAISYCFPVVLNGAAIGAVQTLTQIDSFQRAVTTTTEDFSAYKDVQIVAFGLDGRYLGSTLNLTQKVCAESGCVDSDSQTLLYFKDDGFVKSLLQNALKVDVDGTEDDMKRAIDSAVIKYRTSILNLGREQDSIRRLSQSYTINGESYIMNLEVFDLNIPGGLTICAALYVPNSSIYVVSDLQLLVNIAIAAVLIFFAAITSVPVLRSVKEPISDVTEFLVQFFTRFNYVPPEIGPVERYMHFVTQEVGEEGSTVRKLHRYSLSKLVEMRKMQVGILRIYRCFNVLERFLPKELCLRITECHQGSDKLTLSNEMVAVLYIQIDRFNEIVESLSGERLGMMFTLYLEKIIRVIEKRQAVLTELEGHCILCYFKEKDPIESCMKAILCAIEIKKCATALRARMKARGLPVLTPNCVVNYGNVILGNIGTPQQMKYIVFGQSVSIAKALSPVTKSLGIKVLVTNSAMEYATQSSAMLHSRALLNVNVNEIWNGSGDIVLYEVLVETSAQEVERVQEYRMVYQEYYDAPADSKDAEDIFNYERLCDAFVKKHGADGPTAFLKRRLRGMGKAVLARELLLV